MLHQTLCIVSVCLSWGDISAASSSRLRAVYLIPWLAGSRRSSLCTRDAAAAINYPMIRSLRNGSHVRAILNSCDSSHTWITEWQKKKKKKVRAGNEVLRNVNSAHTCVLDQIRDGREEEIHWRDSLVWEHPTLTGRLLAVKCQLPTPYDTPRCCYVCAHISVCVWLSVCVCVCVGASFTRACESDRQTNRWEESWRETAGSRKINR